MNINGYDPYKKGFDMLAADIQAHEKKAEDELARLRRIEAAITYRIGPASKPASRWRPHGDSCVTPVFTRTDRFTVKHNRRAA